MSRVFKITFLLIVFLSTNLMISQNTYKVIDSQTKEPLTNIEFIARNQIYFTNEDGEAKIPIEIKDSLTIRYPMFRSQTIANNGKNRIIELVPVEKLLDEVVVNPYPAKRIFEEILKNYSSIYYDKPSEYDCTLKQKGILDNKINNLLIANVKVWTLFNGYNFRKGAKANSFFQMSLNSVNYFRTQRSDIQVIPSDLIRLLFLNSEIRGILDAAKEVGIPSQSSTINDGNVLITFETERITNEHEDIAFIGKIIYNTKDKAITYIQVIAEQYNTYRETVINNQKYIRYTTNSEVSYSFIKKDGKYIPSLVELKGRGYDLNVSSREKTPFSGIQTLYFSKFSKGKSGGLKNRMDLSKKLTDNIPDKEINTSDILLSKEEKEFVKE